MNAHKTTLNNGIRLLTVPMPRLESATVTIWAGVGSRYEARPKAGIAHFFEHIVFKGSPKRPSAKAISEAIDNFGGEVNAFTGKELTGFYIKAPTARINDAVDILSDMVINPLIPKADIEKEKGVIASEIDMYEDLPMQNISNVFHSLVFQGSPLEHNVIGTKKTTGSITQSDFKAYQKEFYLPKNIVITIAGGITENQSEKLANQYFSKIKKDKHVSKKFGNNVVNSTKPKLKLEYKKTDQAHIMVGYLGAKMDHSDHYAEEVLRAILSGGMSSRMWTEIREKRGLCYAIRTSIHAYLTSGAFVTYVGTDPKKSSQAVSAILKEFQKLRSISSAKVSGEELKKAKEYIKGHIALSLESTNEVGEFFGEEEILLNKTRTIEEIYSNVDKINIDDVVRVAQNFFKPERLNLAVIGPYKSDKEFEKIIS